MEIGPIALNDISGIEERFQDRGIQYDVLVDEDTKEVYIEVADGDFEKVKDVIENYGLVPVSDGAFELGEE